ncbi:MAG: hypothetical protein AB9869_28580 [Verrucomicrobiia bacterium]
MNTKELSEHADKYVSFAFDELEIPVPEEENDSAGFAAAIESARIHFMFPNLTDSERNVIHALSDIWVSVQVGVTTPAAELSEAEKLRLERELRESERIFVGICALVRGLFPRLTKLQREFIEEKYLTFRFPERTHGYSAE